MNLLNDDCLPLLVADANTILTCKEGVERKTLRSALDTAMKSPTEENLIHLASEIAEASNCKAFVFASPCLNVWRSSNAKKDTATESSDGQDPAGISAGEPAKPVKRGRSKRNN